jgi:hypothetical protein
VQEVFAFALESGCAVWHDTFALSGPNLSAQVGLARLAELAFFAFRGTAGSQPVFIFRGKATY